MMPIHTVQQIHYLDSLPLRRDVLWPSLTPEQCAVAGDEDALHFGIYIDQQLASCLSLFTVDANTFQVRKFATASAFQHQGLGTALLRHAIAHARAAGGQRIILNARTSAGGFYQRHGFNRIGEIQERHGVPFVTMALNL